MRRFFRKYILWGIPLLFPAVAFAQLAAAMNRARGTRLGEIFLIVGGLVGLAIPIVMGLALFAFFWGLAMFIFTTGSAEGRQKGVQIMIWGIIAIFVMVSIVGIVAVIRRSFDL